jgi:uncharacterized protein
MRPTELPGPALQHHDRLGRGWGQPIAPASDGPTPGRLPVVEGPEKVRQAILTLLDTEPGERVMRPDFGCGLRRYLMAPNNPATRAGIRREIEAALLRWEPRVRPVAIEVTPGAEPTQVLVELHYAHALDGRQDLLVFPFYLESGA